MKKRKKKVAPPRIARPSWKSFLTLLESYGSSDQAGKDEIRTTFNRMASAADAYDDLMG